MELKNLAAEIGMMEGGGVNADWYENDDSWGQ